MNFNVKLSQKSFSLFVTVSESIILNFILTKNEIEYYREDIYDVYSAPYRYYFYLKDKEKIDKIFKEEQISWR